jgi:DNA-binding HxlR family transcriptional regulator
VDHESVQALKQFSDPSRLRVLGQLAAGKRYSLEELGAALDMSTGSLVHHLQRLLDAGLVRRHAGATGAVYELRRERLAALGTALAGLGQTAEAGASQHSGPQGRSWPPALARVLRAFIVDGRLESIPVQEKKRLVVLRYLAETVFRPDTEYAEKEVNERLAPLHPDVASLRRHLVDHRFMQRAAGTYRLRPSTDWPDLGAGDDPAA